MNGSERRLLLSLFVHRLYFIHGGSDLHYFRYYKSISEKLPSLFFEILRSIVALMESFQSAPSLTLSGA